MKITTKSAIPGLSLMLVTASCLMLSTTPIAAQPIETAQPLAQTGDESTAGNPVAGNPSIVTIPSGTIPAACKVLAPHQSLLDCYLGDSSEIDIASNVIWYFPNQGQPKPWSQWPDWAKSNLRVAFVNTVAWYNGGMVNYPGTLVADPPPNLNAGLPVAMALDGPTAAWPIYIGHVALNLAAEIYGWVPWSLHNYDNNALYDLLAGENSFWYSDADAGYHNVATATPANAIYTFKFLKSNNLIGATRIDTIGRVLDWARKNLSHMGGGFTYGNFNDYFQYWGDPPVSRIIEGTMTTAPADPYYWGVTHHWTAGCFGTTGFLVWVLKAVSIPVYPVFAGNHTTPWFVGEKLYLSHGDDPYTATSKANFPATLLLINEPTYTAWFPAADHNAGDLNVGRRPKELAVQYPGSQWMMERYCDDIQAGKTHANGRVYNETFKSYFTVPYLENAGLWQRLDQQVFLHGCTL